MAPLNLREVLLISALFTCLAAFSALLVYLLFRRRGFCGRTLGETEISVGQLSSPSKELLYFFCWKSQLARVEPAGPTPTLAHQEAAPEAEEDEVAKWQARYGGSRLLYTIKEEEREGENSSEMEATNRGSRGIRLGDVLVISVLSEVEQDQSCPDDDLSEEPTPFQTPSESPPYYTPSPSPGWNVAAIRSSEHDVSADRRAALATSIFVA